MTPKSSAAVAIEESCQGGRMGANRVSAAAVGPRPTTTATATNTATTGTWGRRHHYSPGGRDSNGSSSSSSLPRIAGSVAGGGRKAHGPGGGGGNSSSGGSLGGQGSNNGGRNGQVKGQEPAAKNHGCMPAATIMKLVSPSTYVMKRHEAPSLRRPCSVLDYIRRRPEAQQSTQKKWRKKN